MTSLHRLPVPAFDLVWYEICKDEKPYVFSLIPGGGGSAKSGVKNQIMIGKAEYPGGVDFQLLDGHLTDADGLTSLCTGISTGVVQENGKDVNVLAAVVGHHCVLFQADVDDSTKKLKLTKRTQFEADFHQEEPPSLNVTLITSFGFVVTGGDDTVVRVWVVQTDNDDKKSENVPSWKAAKLFELKDHIAPISALTEHPSEPWVCSSGKDGACKIWNIKYGTLLINIPYLVDGIPGFDPNKMKMECRGCTFSLDGTSLFSIQSPRRGSTYLIKWGLEKKIEEYPEKETTTKDKEKEQEKEKDNKKDKNKKVLLVAFPSKKKEVHKVPSTRLAISEDGEYLAVGASDGSIVVTKSENLQPVKRLAKHDLPVTGLGFAPHHLTKERELEYFVASCSADNKLCLHQEQGYSTLARLLFILFLLLIIVILFVITFGVHEELSIILNEKVFLPFLNVFK